MSTYLCSENKSRSNLTGLSIVFSGDNGKIVFSRHKGMVTWETQGEHIEQCEISLDVAKCEFFNYYICVV